MAPEQVLAAGGTEVGDLNLVGRHPCQLTPQAVDALQVYQKLLPRQPVDKWVSLLAQNRPHGVGHVLVGLKAAAGDTGADGHADVFGLTAEGLRHHLHGLAHNAGVTIKWQCNVLKKLQKKLKKTYLV